MQTRRMSPKSFMVGLRAAGICTACLLIGSLNAAAQQSLSRAGIGVRTATPAEIKRSIEDEERQIEATPSIEGLPKRLAFYIHEELPALSVLERRDATDDNWRLAMERHQPSAFFCFGDFDGNGLQDAALILRENGRGTLHLIAFHQVEITINPGGFVKRGYQHYEIGSAGVDLPRAPLAELSASCNPPGTFQSVDGDITLGLKNASIMFGYSLYYFDGAYMSLLVGD
jgi:hypothetical protein